jgi:phosphoglycerate dehydrogenase-like enzyme
MNVLISIHSAFAMWSIPPSHVERLRQRFPQHEWFHAPTREAALEWIPQADAAFALQIGKTQLEAATRLRWIHSPAAGVGGMLYPEMVASSVTITNARGMASDTIAEHVLAVTLAMFNQLPVAFRSQLAHEWAQEAISKAGTREIAGSTVLIVGLGAIGRAIARRMHLLGARVVGLRKRVGEPVEGVDEVAHVERLHDYLPSADVVVLSTPATPDTRGLIDARALAAMKRDAILVNVSRGQVIDEPALIEALRAGAIGGASLDVFIDEPLRPDSPFWSLPNLLITPHTSGFRPDYWDLAIDLFGENLRRFESGEHLLNVVDKNAGY